ncbi:MAG: FtsH protease activity modulator HflK [Firmicutes bacterium HGW-Firmicutes-5]|nr:MAG: FtsH protease activity modulator HflK [Firmicutes bacterium HGW-Firmicutes-5]
MNKDKKNSLKEIGAQFLKKIGYILSKIISFTKSQRVKSGKATAIEDIKKAFNHINPKRAVLSLVGGVIIIYVLTGIYIVNPGEQAVIRRFGVVLEQSIFEGIHYRLPYPIDQVQKINVAEVRRADIGVNLPDHLHQEDVPTDIQLLTGDENIISLEAIAHYKVKDAAKFLYNVNLNNERLVRNSIEAALVELTANMAVDDILSTQKVQAQNMVVQKVQTVLDNYDSGIQITEFNIQEIVPPDAVADAFRDVTTAKEDKEKEINQANGYYNSLIPTARGKANDRIKQAEAYKIETINQAQGESQKFEAMLMEYKKNIQIYSQDSTKYRLLLETLEKILPKTKLKIVDAADDKINVKLYDSLQGIGLE